MQVLGGPIQPQEQVRYYNIILLLWYYNDVRGLYKKKKTTDALEAPAIAIITYIATAAVSVTIGLLIGSLITYCFLKKQRESGTVSNGKVERPLNLYEEVTTDKKPATQLTFHTSSSQHGVI